MDTVRLRKEIRRFRWLLVLLSLFVVYTLAGFLLVPYALKSYLTGSLARQWQHVVSVQDVRFNPYSVRLQLDGFEVKDELGTVLLALGQLRFDYEALSVFRFEIGVEEFAIERPLVRLEADGNGSYTLLNMFASKATKAAEPQPGQDEGSSNKPAIIPLLLRSASVHDGTLHYLDPSRAGGFEQVIHLPSLTILDFHTTQSANGNQIVLSLSNNKGATLDLDANVRIDPLSVQGSLALKQLDLAPVWQLMEMPVNFGLQAPVLDVSGRIDIMMTDAGPLSLAVSEGSLSLSGLVLSDLQQQPQLRLPRLAVSDIRLKLPEQQVTIGGVQVADGWVNLVLSREGGNSLQALFAAPEAVSTTQPAPAGQTPPAATASSQQPEPKPWDVLLEHVSVDNLSLEITDEKPADPFKVRISPVSIGVSSWRPLSPEPFNLQIRTGIAGIAEEPKGQLAVDTRLQLSPFMAESHIDLQGLPLALLQPYVHDAVRADIHAGALNAVVDVAVSSTDTLGLVAKGGIHIGGLDVHEKGRDKKLLSWNALAVDDINFDLAGNALQLGQISIDKLNSSFIINADGTTNIHDLLVPRPAPAEPSSPMHIQIGAIAIQDADLGFADLTMKPNFRVAMKQLSGAVKGLSTDPSSMASIDLKGKVDRYAPVTIKGKLNPLIEQPRLDARLAFKNLELTTFTPYSGTYAGFKIEKGQLSLDIDYKLVNNKIEGKNHIVMNQLQLGETVQSEKAVSLPLRLAIALLRDEKGVIDLGFEVGGDLNDPQFSISGILWKVLSNMVMKVVSSPFSLLSGLAGDEQVDGMDQIGFAAGQDAVDDGAKAKLERVAELLAKRSGLSVNIQGNVLPDQDKPALQQQKLLATLVQRGKDVPPEAYASGEAAADNGSAYKILGRYYQELRNDELGDVADRIRDEMKARGEKPERKQLRVLAYEQARQRLQEDVPVSDEELRQLAMQRSRNIKAMLVEQLGVAPERIFVIDPNAESEKASLSSQLTLDAR